MMNDPIVIVSAARTPMGAFQGELKDFSAAQLGAAAIRAAVERAGIKPEQVQEVVMGCVLAAGQGQAPARQASIGGGLPLATGATTVNKMCGSGMKAAMFAHDMLAAGVNQVMVAGGMESMTNAPYLLPKARSGYRMGHQQVIDHMTWLTPAASMSCANIAAFMPEPHILLTVVAPVASGRPPPMLACRAGACPWPAASTQPITTSCTCSGLIPARSTAARIAAAPSCAAEKSFSSPWNAPMGVLAAETITIGSFIMAASSQFDVQAVSEKSSRPISQRRISEVPAPIS